MAKFSASAKIYRFSTEQLAHIRDGTQISAHSVSIALSITHFERMKNSHSPVLYIHILYIFASNAYTNGFWNSTKIYSN